MAGAHYPDDGELILDLTLIPSTAATEPDAREALRGIKARRRKGDPMTCCCCPTKLGAAPFTLVMGRGAMSPSGSSQLIARAVGE